MAIVPNFTASQNITTPTVVTITDSSTGSDGAITGRLVAMQLYDGTYLTPTGTSTTAYYFSFPLSSGSSIALTCMSQDYAVNITILWVGGSTTLYSKLLLFEFNAYARTYRCTLLKAIASNSDLLDSSNFFSVYSNITCYIDGANEAVALMGDITTSQLCNNKAKVYIDNQILAY
jgi:hypothetical protein